MWKIYIKVWCYVPCNGMKYFLHNRLSKYFDLSGEKKQEKVKMWDAYIERSMKALNVETLIFQLENFKKIWLRTVYHKMHHNLKNFQRSNS